MALERSEDDGAELARDRRVLGDLQVVLDLRTLMPGRGAAVDPCVAGAVEPGAHRRNLRGTQYVGNCGRACAQSLCVRRTCR